MVHKDDPDFQIGKGIIIREGGKDVCLLSTGNLLPIALEVADSLVRSGIDAQLVSMHTVKPLDEALLEKVFSEFGIGALVVKDDVGRYAEKAGLFVLTQTSDGGAALLNRKDFRPKEFS